MLYCMNTFCYKTIEINVLHSFTVILLKSVYRHVLLSEMGPWCGYTMDYVLVIRYIMWYLYRDCYNLASQVLDSNIM